VTVANARLVLAAAASTFFDHPSTTCSWPVSRHERKTTCAYLLARSSMPPAALGTHRHDGYRIGQTERDLARTTPESPDVQALLREMVRAVQERASWRCRRTRWRCIVQTTSALARHLHELTRDHLDFHSGMEDYFLAKRRLFELLPEDARRSSTSTTHTARAWRRPSCVTYGINRQPTSPLVGRGIGRGTAIRVRTPRGLLHIQSPLTGRETPTTCSQRRHAVALDIPFGAIERDWRRAARPGRFEVVSGHGTM